jgi:CTP:molybdopterin cytidylyltransferase MocA
MKITAIVLAAGKSSRMGSNKLLLKLENKTIIEHILDNLAEYETIVVTGYQSEEIEPFIKQFGVQMVLNQEYERGMVSSFQTGLQVLNSDVEAVFIVLSDTFGFKPELLKKMELKMASTGAQLVSPTFQGRLGHPVLVSKELFQEFLDLSFDESMKDVVIRHKKEHEHIIGSIWTKIDLDTPDDYDNIKKLWATR